MAKKIPETFERLAIEYPVKQNTNEQLIKLVLSNLETIYGKPLPEMIVQRLIEELYIVTLNGYGPLFLAHMEIVNCIKELKIPFYNMGSNGASLINYALGISDINPLPSHFKCSTCNHVEFIKESEFNSAFLLPEKKCVNCGGRMNGDGYNLNMNSFLGFYYDRKPQLSLCVPLSKYHEILSKLKTMFDVKKDVLLDEQTVSASMNCYVPFNIIPLEKMPEIKIILSANKIYKPIVFQKLTDSEIWECYVTDSASIGLVKDLLKSVSIENFYDLYKICGLINSYSWLSYILPQIKSGNVDFRNTITTREDVFDYLVEYGINPEKAYEVMEKVRKGQAKTILVDTDLKNRLNNKSNLTELVNIDYLITRAQAFELANMIYINALQYSD